MPSTHLHRYPGLKPFSEEEQLIFYGRESDISSVLSYLQVHNLVVLQSKSGLGKTSLINAGLIPRLREKEKNVHHEVIKIRLNNPEKTPLSIVKNALEALLEDKRKKASPEAVKAEAFLYNVRVMNLSLWQLVKCYDMLCASSEGLPSRILFVFDQFEELLNYSEKDVSDFASELADLYYQKIPTEFSKVLEMEKYKDPNTGKYINEPFSLFLKDHPEWESRLGQSHKPLMTVAIRSDKLILLHRLSQRLPEIVLNKYELKALSREAAHLAINKPASIKASHFVSHTFIYTEEAIKKILDFLTQNDTREIESAQLQIICQHIEEKINADKDKDKENYEVKARDIEGQFSDILTNYYRKELSTFESKDADIARKFIEDNLILEEDNRRISLDEGLARRKLMTLGLSEERIDNFLIKLMDMRILRREISNLDNVYNYELSHDTLVAPILAEKRKRNKLEGISKRERLLKKRFRIYTIALVILLLAGITTTIVISSYISNQRIREAEAQAKMEIEAVKGKREEYIVNKLLAILKNDPNNPIVKPIVDSIQSMNSMIDKLNMKYEGLKNAQEVELYNLQKYQGEISRLENANASLKQQSIIHEQTIKHYRELYERGQQAPLNIQMEVNRLKQELEKLEKENVGLKKEVKDLQVKYKGDPEEQQKLEATINSQKQKIKDLNEELAKYKSTPAVSILPGISKDEAYELSQQLKIHYTGVFSDIQEYKRKGGTDEMYGILGRLERILKEISSIRKYLEEKSN